MIGFGYSDKPETFEYTIHTYADIAEALLKQLKISQFHLLSHDLGDSVAQEIIARRAEAGSPHLEISSWLILNGGVFPDLHRPRLIQKLLLNSWTGMIAQRLLTFGGFKRSFGEIFGPIGQPTETEFKDYYGLILHNGGKLLSYKLIHYITDRQKHGERWVRNPP